MKVNHLEQGKFRVATVPGRNIRKKALKPLINGHEATCPRCRKSMDLLELEILPEIFAYEAETTPVLRCPYCRWLFALRNGPDYRPDLRRASQ
jgi:DNA-directed RNA polymerase subunit RPC12/RpoP